MKAVEKVTYSENEHQETGAKINAHRLTPDGRELVDSRPMAPPVGFVAEESVFDKMRQMMRAASLEAAMAGNESLEEANDFYVEDDPQSGLPPSEYEFDEDHQTELENFIRSQNQPQEAAEASPPGKKGPKPKTPPSPAPEPSDGVEGDE